MLLTGLLLAGSAAAESAPLPDDLYLEAMQSIAEGRHGDAGELLERMIARGPRHAGEWLDLALIECALGRETQAEGLFRDIEARFAPPPGIRDIIGQRRAQGCAIRTARQQWSLGLARGTDSNVNQGASNPFFNIGNGAPLELLPSYWPRGDQYTVLSGEYLRDLTRNGDLGFFQAQLRQQDHLSGFDTASLFAGAEHPWRLANWRMRSFGLGGLLTLGGKLYQSQAQLQLSATPPLRLPEHVDFSLLAGMSRTRYQTLINFDATTMELRGILGYRAGPGTLQLSLGLLSDNGHTARPGGDRSGWSARLSARTRLAGKLEGEFDWLRQNWQGSTSYAPGLIEERRRQATRALRATLIYPLAADQALHLEWRQVHNAENISIFQYDSRQLQLSWHWYGH